jgi:uncharacterized protein
VDRVFLDANVLFSAAYRERCGILNLWELAGIELVTSAFAAEEATRNLSTDVERERLNQLLEKLAIVDEAPAHLEPPAEVTLPTKDVPILMSAIGASATHLLTGDKRHFGPLFGQSIEGMLILPPAEYLSARAASGPHIEGFDSNT